MRVLTPSRTRHRFLLLTLPLCLCIHCGYPGSLCANDIAESIPSPDGKFKAAVFTRDCGATTGFSTQVSILPVGDTLPNDGGNVFWEAKDEGSKVGVTWKGNRQLHIRHKTAGGCVKSIRVSTDLFREESVTVTDSP